MSRPISKSKSEPLLSGNQHFKRVTQEAQFPTHSIKSFYGIIL
jgi:hypothetical protein